MFRDWYQNDICPWCRWIKCEILWSHWFSHKHSGMQCYTVTHSYKPVTECGTGGVISTSSNVYMHHYSIVCSISTLNYKHCCVYALLQYCALYIHIKLQYYPFWGSWGAPYSKIFYKMENFKHFISNKVILCQQS